MTFASSHLSFLDCGWTSEVCGPVRKQHTLDSAGVWGEGLMDRSQGTGRWGEGTAEEAWESLEKTGFTNFFFFLILKNITSGLLKGKYYVVGNMVSEFVFVAICR